MKVFTRKNLLLKNEMKNSSRNELLSYKLRYSKATLSNENAQF